MGWLSRFFSTKSGGPFQATIPPLPIQCIVKPCCYGEGTQQEALQAQIRDQFRGREEPLLCVLKILIQAALVMHAVWTHPDFERAQAQTQ